MPMGTPGSMLPIEQVKAKAQAYKDAQAAKAAEEAAAKTAVDAVNAQSKSAAEDARDKPIRDLLPAEVLVFMPVGGMRRAAIPYTEFRQRHAKVYEQVNALDFLITGWCFEQFTFLGKTYTLRTLKDAEQAALDTALRTAIRKATADAPLPVIDKTTGKLASVPEAAMLDSAGIARQRLALSLREFRATSLIDNQKDLDGLTVANYHEWAKRPALLELLKVFGSAPEVEIDCLIARMDELQTAQDYAALESLRNP